jgi:hypothetical protein
MCVEISLVHIYDVGVMFVIHVIQCLDLAKPQPAAGNIGRDPVGLPCVGLALDFCITSDLN